MCANGPQAPVTFDEFDDGNMVSIAVVDHATGGIRRDDEKRDAGAIAEEVDRLDITGVIVSAAFIEGDEDGSARPQRRSLHLIDDLVDEALEEIELGGSW